MDVLNLIHCNDILGVIFMIITYCDTCVVKYFRAYKE